MISIWKHAGLAGALALGIAAVDAGAQSSLPETVTTQPAAVTTPVRFDPQVKDDLLEGLERLGVNARERNEVNLDKATLALAGGKRGGRYGDLAGKMDAISVRNYEFAQKGQYQRSDLDALRRRLEGNGWSHLVRNESEGETNDIVIRSDRDGFISDMVILNAEPKELNIVHLRGHFHMDDVQGAMGSLGHAAAAPQPPTLSPEPKKR